MAGGGGGNQTSTVYQSNLPEYARPYYESMMDNALVESRRPYQPYPGQRITGMSSDTGAGLDMSREFAGSGTGLENPYSMSGMAGWDAFGRSQERFGQPQASFYMSPYMDNVVARAQQNAIHNFDQQRAARDSEAVRAGAFGGSRQQVAESIAQEGLFNRLNDIATQGYQSAFENAQGQFNADRAGAYQGLGLTGQLSGQMADILGQNDSMLMNRMRAQLAAGQTEEEYFQQQLDQAYNDFVNQRDSSRQNLQFLSSILRGVPISANQDVTTTESSNPLAGILGSASGIQALSQLGQQ